MLGKEHPNNSLQSTLADRYEIVDTIGSGTFGEVYLVMEKSTKQIYAMKHVLQKKKYKNRQLQIMSQLESPFIVKLHCHFYTQQNNENYLSLIMEYLPQTLSKNIKGNLPYQTFLDNQIIMQYTRCLFVALRDLHIRNICHRDIKPSNVLIKGNVAKLCDFGSAKVLTEGQKNISYICSRYYRAPELLMGAIFYTCAVDIWSLGCVVAEMLTNRAFFEGKDTTAMLIKIVKTLGGPSVEDIKGMGLEESEINIMNTEGTGIRQRILKVNPNADHCLLDMIEKMLQYNPSARLSASEALELPMFKVLK